MGEHCGAGRGTVKYPTLLTIAVPYTTAALPGREHALR